MLITERMLLFDCICI